MVLLGQPFDIIKVRLQTNRHVYKSVFDCIKELYITEGMFAFYKGTLSPLIGISFCVAVGFIGNEFAKRYFHLYHALKGDNNHKLSIKEFMISGGFSGLFTAFPVTPVELIRIKIQTNGNKYKGTIDCLRNLFRNYGFCALFQGLWITMIREVPANIVYFGLYESLMQIAENKYSQRKNIPNSIILSCGGLSGIMMWLVVFPIDLVKTNIQTQDFNNKKTIINASKQIWYKNGVKGFFNGLLPCLVRAPLINAATFFTFEKMKRYLNG
jgi:solute carrier family 25 carnitine/acylcarnitine transporter 20/29